MKRGCRKSEVNSLSGTLLNCSKTGDFLAKQLSQTLPNAQKCR